MAWSSGSSCWRKTLRWSLRVVWWLKVQTSPPETAGSSPPHFRDPWCGWYDPKSTRTKQLTPSPRIHFTNKKAKLRGAKADEEITGSPPRHRAQQMVGGLRWTARTCAHVKGPRFYGNSSITWSWGFWSERGTSGRFWWESTGFFCFVYVHLARMLTLMNNICSFKHWPAPADWSPWQRRTSPWDTPPAAEPPPCTVASGCKHHQCVQTSASFIETSAGTDPDPSEAVLKLS